MTRTEMLTVVMNDERLAQDVRDTAAEMLEKIQSANARKVERNAEKRAAKIEAEAPLYATAREMLSAASADAPLIAATLAKALDGVSSSKASVILRALVAEGVATVADVKIKGDKGTRTVKGYFPA